MLNAFSYGNKGITEVYIKLKNKINLYIYERKFIWVFLRIFYTTNEFRLLFKASHVLLFLRADNFFFHINNKQCLFGQGTFEQE